MHGQKRRKSFLKSPFQQAQTIDNVGKANKAAKIIRLAGQSSTTVSTNPYLRTLASKPLGVISAAISPVSTGTLDTPQYTRDAENEKYRNQKTYDGISLYNETNDMSKGGKSVFTPKTEQEIKQERLNITMSQLNRL